MTDELTENGILTDHPDVALIDYVDLHGEPVYVGPDRVAFRDEHGHGLNEWADVLGVGRGELSGRIHELAREVYGRDESDGTGDPWSVSDPVVFDADTFRQDDFEAIALLQRRGVSAAVALDWFATEKEYWSHSEWADWRGVAQQAVSENVSKARDKLDGS